MDYKQFSKSQTKLFIRCVKVGIIKELHQKKQITEAQFEHLMKAQLN